MYLVNMSKKVNTSAIHDKILTIFNHIKGESFLNDLNAKIDLLLKNAHVVGVTENKLSDISSIQKASEILSSIKLILEIVEAQLKCDESYVCSISLESIFQTVRDIIDDNPHETLFNDALELLQLLVRLCVTRGSDSDVNSVTNFYMYQMHLVSNITGDNVLLCKLEAINIVLKILCEANNNDFILQFKKKYDDISDFDDKRVYLKLTFECNEHIAAHTMLFMLPHHLKIFNSSSLLLILWYEALYLTMRENGGDVLRSFTVLCFLLDLFSVDKSDEGSANFKVIFEDERCWSVIQIGMCHQSQIVRKQALFLIKQGITEICDRKLTINSHKLNEISGSDFKDELCQGSIKLVNGMKNFTIVNSKVFLIDQTNDCVMWWDPDIAKQLNHLYNDVFLVYETCEEKQAHIVKPVCATFDRLLDAAMHPFPNGKRLNKSWILLLFNRIVHHDNVAVVRWGIRQLMELNESFYGNKITAKELIHLIITPLKESNVFLGDLDNMRKDLTLYFQCLAKFELSSLYYQYLIEEISMQRWNPETLFIVLDSCKDIELPSWGRNELTLVKKLVVSSIDTHYTYLRAAEQCHLMTLLVHLTDVSTVSLDFLAEILFSFRSQECLQRGSKSWLFISQWLEYCFSKRCTEEFLISNLPFASGLPDPSKISRMVCLLYDANLFGIMKCCGEAPTGSVIEIFKNMLASLREADKRLYSKPDELNYNLAIIRCVLKENVAVHNAERCHLVEIMLPHLGDVLAFVVSRCRILRTNDDFESAKNLIDVVEYVLKAQNMFSINPVPYITNLFQYSLTALGITGSASASCMEKFVAMHLLKNILELVYHETPVPHIKSLRIFFKTNLNIPLSKMEHQPSLDSSLWGRINSFYLEAQWWIVGKLRTENVLTLGSKVIIEKFFETEELASLCLTALHLSASTLLLPVIAVVEEILPELPQSRFEEMVTTCWSAVLETRKSEMFTNAAKRFIAMLFQPELFRSPYSHALLLEYSTILLSETINGLACSFITHVQTLNIKYEPCPIWAPLLAEALSFGPVARREERLTFQVSSIISSLSCSANDLLSNEWNTGKEVRARALAIVMTLEPGTHQELADSIANSLILKDEEVFSGKSRYFGGSQLHLRRTRILQALLILEPFISQEKSITLYEWLCASLLKESQQPSVRYLTEWLIIRLISKMPHLQDCLWLNFTDALHQRVGSLCSFISIIYHATGILSDSVIEVWIDRAIMQFIPYCLAQHFSVRLYAQVALEKIWILAEARGLANVLMKYAVVRECLSRGVGNGNALRNAEKLKNDFYWTVFDPLQHYSILTIYRDLPRLAHVPDEEWLSADILSRIGVSKNKIFLPWTTSDVLKEYPIASWTVRSEEDILEVEGENFQKKMIPVRSLVPDYSNLISTALPLSSRKKKSEDGLIVVASLVDRAANLGGLSRTCESFGVSELVIDSLKILEDKQFLSLSVTSEKWVSFTEIKSHRISDYILHLKQNGYEIIGAEQTSKSVPLQQVQFPKRSVLLLGNEKEGLPPQLLPLLDVCVEVPQLGVIRSLNVHVTGALFIWEYAKQHLIENQDK